LVVLTLTCPYCSSTVHQHRIGTNRSGSQRVQCQQCRRTYTPEPKAHGYRNEVRLQAVKLYLEGNNFRRIARLLNVAPQSVINWVNAHHAALPAAPDRSQDRAEVIEMDELYTFVGDKKTESMSSRS
jgi:transposase-like protein